MMSVTAAEGEPVAANFPSLNLSPYNLRPSRSQQYPTNRLLSFRRISLRRISFRLGIVMVNYLVSFRLTLCVCVCVCVLCVVCCVCVCARARARARPFTWLLNLCKYASGETKLTIRRNATTKLINGVEGRNHPDQWIRRKV